MTDPARESIEITDRGQWLDLRRRDVTASAIAALVIEHASNNRLRRARLRVVEREALPLFDKEGAP